MRDSLVSVTKRIESRLYSRFFFLYQNTKRASRKILTVFERNNRTDSSDLFKKSYSLAWRLLCDEGRGEHARKLMAYRILQPRSAIRNFQWKCETCCVTFTRPGNFFFFFVSFWCSTDWKFSHFVVGHVVNFWLSAGSVPPIWFTRWGEIKIRKLFSPLPCSDRIERSSLNIWYFFSAKNNVTAFGKTLLTHLSRFLAGAID